MRVEEYLRRHGRPMHTPQMSCLPMQTQWSDSAIWPTGFCFKPDLKWCHWLYLWRSWAPYNTMESRSSESWGFAALCRSYIRKRRPPWQLFRFCRWNSPTHLKTKWASENCVQWPKEGPCIKIPILVPTKWTYWQPIWTSWWVCNKTLVF